MLELREVEKPAVPDDGVLVRVRACSVNPADWHYVVGQPYLLRPSAGLRRPKDPRVGADFAGTVEAVGAAVEHFQPGDDVFGISGDSFAEYVCRPEDRAIVPKPSGLTFEQAAAVPLAALTALQGLRDKGRVQAGQKVLINGASGGVGTFAVQIAKALGAEVTGVTSTQNVDLVRSLGADHVVDYTRGDFTRSGKRYDVLLDNAGGRSWSDVKRVLVEKGILVRVGGPKGGPILGAVKHLLVMKVASIGSSQTVALFLAKPNRDDLLVLRDLVEEEKLRPAIDRTYELKEVPEALEYLGTKHARAKVVISV